MQFRDSFYSLCPPWLTVGNAERYMYTLELMRDLLMEKSNQAQKVRLPGQGDASQIPYLAFDRQLVQGPLEPDASFIERLKNAFPTWNESGSAPAVLGQLWAYAQGYQDYDRPQFAIVSNPRTLADASRVTAWWTVDYDDPEPLLSTVPHNFDWDGHNGKTWRVWLILYQYLDAPLASGSSGTTDTAGGGSFTDPGHLVAGVWVPRTSGTPINAPFLTVRNLAGVPPDGAGMMITISGSANPDNNGTFQIARVLSSSDVVIVNKDGVASDPGPLTWEIAAYPWMPPGPAWGTPGLVWGEGEGTPPPVDTGSNVGGIWQPTTLGGAGQLPSFSWGLRVSSLEIQTIRGLVRTWKSAGTYYPNFIVSYGADEYTRTGAEGVENPNGGFGSVGRDVAGVWVPTRELTSPLDAFCQGTGRAIACGVENIT